MNCKLFRWRKLLCIFSPLWHRGRLIKHISKNPIEPPPLSQRLAHPSSIPHPSSPSLPSQLVYLMFSSDPIVGVMLVLALATKSDSPLRPIISLHSLRCCARLKDTDGPLRSGSTLTQSHSRSKHAVMENSHGLIGPVERCPLQGWAT